MSAALAYPNLSLNDAIAALDGVIDRGGPAPTDYALVGDAFARMHGEEYEAHGGLARRVRTNPVIADFFTRHRAVFGTTATMQGMIRLKPHGYAGDFETIERIYAHSCSELGNLRSWDRMFHATAGSRAVRNRAMVFDSLVNSRAPVSAASLACGPALDVAAALPGSSIRRLTLLDNDPNALRRARVNLPETDAEVSFEHRNVIRWRPTETFDLIWCSGLFDYLADKTAVFLLQRLRAALAPGGALVIGNFAPGHASRAYMESVGEWLLIHRTDRDLLSLALAAGARADQTCVMSEPTGVNLFLVMES